jgi:ubiquinone biosynthesis protein
MNNSFKRAGQVVNVLFKHGLGYFVHELGLKWHLPFLSKLSPRGKPPVDLPVRLREAMEELGGAYLKLGQFLALRPDLLPSKYCDEFRKMLDEVPPMPFAKVEQAIEAGLKAQPKVFFSSIEQHPIGSASVAQVHKAKLRNGKSVVVKVQRPEAKAQFSADINIMYYLARKIEKRFNDRAVMPVTIVKEFERYTAQELNFVSEAQYIDKFHKFFKDSSKVVVPAVHWIATSPQILTMDYLEGKKLTDVIGSASSKEREKLAETIADAAFDQVLKLGLFHADMHPGNILVLPNGKIGLLDFGIVGALNETLVKQTIALYAAIVEKDSAAITSILLKAGVAESGADIEDFKRDVETILNGWYGTDIGRVRVTQMMQKLFESAVEHNISMPVGFILLGKALVTVEGTCLTLDPEFNFVEYSQPKVVRLLKEHRRPKMLIKKFSQLSKEYAEVLAGIPMQASAALEKVKSGAIDLNLRETDIKHLGMDLNRSSNRLSYAMIIASLLVTGALLVEVPPKFGTYSVFTIISICFAAVLLMALIVSVWREGSAPFDAHRELGGPNGRQS